MSDSDTRKLGKIMFSIITVFFFGILAIVSVIARGFGEVTLLFISAGAMTVTLILIADKIFERVL